MMTGGTPMDWKPPYVTYVFLVKNGMLDYESLRKVAVRTRTFIIFQTLNHNAWRHVIVFWVPHQQWIKQNSLEIGRYPMVHLLIFLLRGCWIHVHTQPPFSTACSGIPFDGPIKTNFPKAFQKLPILLGFLIGRFRSFRAMEVQSGSPRPLDASRQQKTNLHLVDVQQFL